jgi:hypothetical protein
LCGIEARTDLDGVSLMPLLKNPDQQWERPAVMTYGRGNHAVRSQRWRYIHYSDGSEELYDHKNDPNEWHNVAGKSEYKSVIEKLKKWLPEQNAQAAPDMKPWRSQFDY